MTRIRIAMFAAAVFFPCLLAAGSAKPRFTTLYSFTGGADGAAPQGLVTGPNGLLYGATPGGGATGNGTLFALEPPSAPGGDWTETVLHSFAGYNTDGSGPYAPPTVGPNGILYGTTYAGGYYGEGIVYQLTPPASSSGAWTETILFTFYVGDNGGTGYAPYSGVLIGSNGDLYGLTIDAGNYYFGTAYQLSPPGTAGSEWTLAGLYSFTGDGRIPAGAVLNSKDVLYGATKYGGSGGAGTVFSLRPAAAGGPWTQTILYAFTGGADGGVPIASPVIAPDGTIYGSTSGGGAAGSGTIFQLTPPAKPAEGWTYAVLYSFPKGGGKLSDSPLLLDHGNLYGTTASGTGAKNRGGTVFELRRPSAETGAWTAVTLHQFPAAAAPSGSLAIGADGAIYGTTSAGGTAGAGSVYRIAK